MPAWMELRGKYYYVCINIFLYWNSQNLKLLYGIPFPIKYTF